MVLFNLRGPSRIIDKIGIRDGHLTVHGFEGLTFGPSTICEQLKLHLHAPATFAYGLEVTIHVNYPEITGSQQLTQILI